LSTEIKNKKNIFSYVVFILTITIVGLNFISVLYPALLVPIFVGSENQINPFEPGGWALPALLVNVILLYIGILYYVKKIPNVIQKAIKFILKFEVSPKIATITIMIILGAYVAFTIQDLSIDEISEQIDFARLEPVIDDFPYAEDAITSIRILIVKNFLIYSSNEIFDNVKVIPYIGSIALLVLTYFFTAKITNKRFAGIVAMVILLQSYTFLQYDTTATYSNFWTLFYLLSLYVIYNKWYLSPASYILSIFSKPFSAIFLPMTLFFIYRTNISKRKKINSVISYVIIISVMALGLLVLDINIEGKHPKEIFNSLSFWASFTTMTTMLRFDGIILLFLPSLTIGLFWISRKGISIADAVLFLIGGVLLSTTFLASFTDYNLAPYRYMPLVVFFAIGVGTLFSKKIIQQESV